MTEERDARLDQELEAIAAHASTALEREVVAKETGAALERAWPLALAVPVGALLVELFRWAGADVALPPIGWLIAGAVAVPLLYVAILRVAAALRPVDRRRALVEVDRAIGAEERLLTASEFLAWPTPRSTFVEAAIADAEPWVARAHAAVIERPRPPIALPRSLVVATVAAVLLLLVAGRFGTTNRVAIDEPTAGDRVEVADLDPPPTRTSDGSESGARTETPPPDPVRKKTDVREKGEHTPGEAREERLALSEDVKKTRGSLGDGRAADAASASSSGEAKGSPTNQAQAGDASKKPAKPKAKEPKPGKDPDAERAPPKAPEEDSGATAGRGAAAGSNKSPASSPWSSKDQVVSEDEEDLEQDEEVDDEYDDSDARGGLQPNLRDRRPPVNRDLGIGFGNAKNPDANGRGGPSEQKKSRGVAALVLGVPIPDHVKGKPNPGKTKITQERVEPKAEDAAEIDGEKRTARAAPVGHLAHPDLVPWMRELVRSYYLKLRNETGE